MSAVFKSLTVTTYKLPAYLQQPHRRELLLTMSGGAMLKFVSCASVQGYELADAEGLVTLQMAGLARPVVEYYGEFLRGGALPQALHKLPTTHRFTVDGDEVDMFEVPEAAESQRVAAIRGIVRDKSARIVEAQLIDMYSAGTFLAVYDHTNAANKATLLAMTIERCIACCYRSLATHKAKHSA